MKAVLFTSETKTWAAKLGTMPWSLLPVANRPLIDYWLESCAELGIDDVQIFLGDGAERIEYFTGEGERWGLNIRYSFPRVGETPEKYLEENAEQWAEGLFFVSDAVFMRRTEKFSPELLCKEGSWCLQNGTRTVFILSSSFETVSCALENTESTCGCASEELEVELCLIDSIRAYYDLNMSMVSGEFSRYVTSGFSDRDGSSVGYNVHTPPSARLQAPLIIGNDCRLGALSTIGPKAIICNHVIVDGQSELSDCLILPNTYIGRNLEIKGKIVAGNLLVDPVNDTIMEISDSWIVAKNLPETTISSGLRMMVFWGFTLILAMVQVIPFLLIFLLIVIFRRGGYREETFHDPKTGYLRLPVFHPRGEKSSFLLILFRAASLDRFVLLPLVLRKKLYLCGQQLMRHPADDTIVQVLPHYFPAVFSYADFNRDSDRLVDALYYDHARSLLEDLKILWKALVFRFIRPTG